LVSGPLHPSPTRRSSDLTGSVVLVSTISSALFSRSSTVTPPSSQPSKLRRKAMPTPDSSRSRSVRQSHRRGYNKEILGQKRVERSEEHTSELQSRVELVC